MTFRANQRWFGHGATAAAGFTAAFAWSGVAWAQDTAPDCARGFEKAQTERIQSRLRAAKEAAKACSSIECPNTIINECMKLYATIESEIPTVVFSARDPQGKDLIDVRVAVDGVVVSERIDGRTHELDPGQHQFRFEAAGTPPVDVTQTVRVGDHHRLVEVMLGEPPPPTPTGLPLAPLPATEPRERTSSVPVAAYVLGGVGVVGLAGFAYLRLSADSDFNDLKTTCSPRCHPDEGEQLRTKIQFSYLALGVGAAALAGAGVVWLVSRPSSKSASSIELRMGAMDRGAGARLRAQF